MDPDSSYCSANVGPPISFAMLIILVILYIKVPFSQKWALFALLICLMGDAFIISMVIVCSDYYLFHLAFLILMQALLTGLWYNNMIVWEVTRTVTTTDDFV